MLWEIVSLCRFYQACKILDLWEDFLESHECFCKVGLAQKNQLQESEDFFERP